MSTVRKVDQETMKNLNRQMILNFLRNNGETSRIDLAKKMKLSPTTVSAITSELVKEKLVLETRIGESNGGRKPLMLGINPDAKFAMTVILTQKGVDISIVNMSFQRIEHESISKRIEDPGTLEETLLKGFKDILGRFRYDKEDICGVGVSVPGVVDHKNGIILYSSKMRLEDYNISQLIKEITGIDVYVFKDTDALMLGEYDGGIGNIYSSVAYISIEDGIGMSYINSGKLFHPSIGGGFELGHITIDSNGPVCRCGNRGCLGAMVSEQSVLNKLKILSEKGYKTFIDGDIEKLSLSDVVEYSNKGDKLCIYVLEEQARVLGIAVATVVNLFSPQLVLIGGPLGGCRWGFMDVLEDTVKDRALSIYSRNLHIEPARHSSESALTGISNEIFNRQIFKTVDL